MQSQYNTAVAYADSLDSGAEVLICALRGSPVSEGSAIRVMPNVHAGKGCVVGTTMNSRECVAPESHGL